MSLSPERGQARAHRGVVQQRETTLADHHQRTTATLRQSARVETALILRALHMPHRIVMVYRAQGAAPGWAS